MCRGVIVTHNTPCSSSSSSTVVSQVSQVRRTSSTPAAISEQLADLSTKPLSSHETRRIMTASYLYLLVYLVGSCLGTSVAQRNETCTTKEACVQGQEPTSRFLQCVGLPSRDTATDHVRRLKGMLAGAMDVYTFMRSSMKEARFLSLQEELALNPAADPLHNEALVQMWLEVKITPLLKSVSKHFLSCLSTKNFNCATYQTVVRELSLHYSEMEPVRQKWIYSFFMYPFLSGDRVAGCVSPEQSSEDWLVKNFGAFRAEARMEDLSTLNLVFSGLEVLDLLSPAQKAELLLRPGVHSLDNGTLSLVLQSLLAGGPPPTAGSNGALDWGSVHNWTDPGSPPPDLPAYKPRPPPSPLNKLKQIISGVMAASKPIGSFIRDFVSFTRERKAADIKSTTLTQFLLNWTLAELANVYRPPSASVAPEVPQVNLTGVEAWYQHAVVPVLREFLPSDAALMHPNIQRAFQELFYLDHNAMENGTSEIQDICSITIDRSQCGLTDAVANVAKVLHCAADSNLTMSEETVVALIDELTQRLHSLMEELLTSDLSAVVSDFKELFSEPETPSMSRERLDDPSFIELWFKVKVAPLGPHVPVEVLSCLSVKNFSCPAFQTIVAEFSKNNDYGYTYIYMFFIYPFLLNHTTTDPQCVMSTNSSAEWLTKNFGAYSKMASVADFYKLNPNFSGLDVLPLLTPRQWAEMLVLPLPTPPERDVVINRVFDFLLDSPVWEQLSEVAYYLRYFIPQVNPPCIVYEYIFERLYRAVPLVPRNIEPSIWNFIGELMRVAPDECVPVDLMCPEIPFNGTIICEGVNSSQLLHMNPSMDVDCSYTLESYTCAQLENFTANQMVSLLKCNLPGNSWNSRVLWKTLLTKLSFVLDPALDILANQSTIGSSATAVLDVIRDIRVSRLTDEQLMNSSVVGLWFSERLSAFLPFASGRFLHCLTRRNLSCHSYQQILHEFTTLFDTLSYEQQRAVLKDFILRFLPQPHSGPGCVSASNNSAEWVARNLGPFFGLLDFRELLQLSPELNFLEVVQFLTPQQAAHLVTLLPDSPEKDSIINKIFDRLTESPDKLEMFLYYLDGSLYQANLSCSSYKTLLDRLDMIKPTVPVWKESLINNIQAQLSYQMPKGCIMNSGECNVTTINQRDICVGVNSTLLQSYLDRGQTHERFCDFSVEEIACASLPALATEDLAAILVCNRSSFSAGSRPAWKLLLQKASHVLDAALDLLTNATLDPRNPAVSMVLDAIREIRLDMSLPGSLSDPAFIQLWFQIRLGGFLPAASTDFLSCLTTKGLNCTGYQHLVQILSDLRPQMTLAGQISVYTHFMKSFLSRNGTSDSSCSSNINSSGEWLQKNLGGFSFLASFHDLEMLYSNFSALTALPQLTVRQLAEVSATPGQLTSPQTVAMVTRYIPDRSLAAFFDDFSPAIRGHENDYPSDVRSAFLQVVFDRANLSDPSTPDEVVLEWLLGRVRPLLVAMSPNHVAPLFRILVGRNCSIEQQGVEILNSTISSLSQDTQREIYNNIVQALTGPIPLKCYGDNYNLSFYGFLERSFLGFQFPNLTAFLSLMPPDRRPQLLNSIPPSALGNFLRRPGVVDNAAQLCVIYGDYIQTPKFLETETLPESVRRPTLPCVWPVALGSSNRSEVNAWFDRRLRNYLAFLTKGLISPDSTLNASCLAFQKLVSVLGGYNYTAVDFGRKAVFDSIRAYLASAGAPRCYDPGNPDLNSTAWFAEYIGPFMAFLTLGDLQTFGSAQVIQVFTVNPLNIALLNNTPLPLNLTNYYVALVYQQDSNFNPLLLPPLGRCVAPGPAFSQLSPGESMMVLENLTAVCTSVDPQVSAALAGNFGNNIDASVISALGTESTGLSTGQIEAISPQQLLMAISTLSGAPGWNQGQAWAIVQSLQSSGAFQINGTSLLVLGTVIVGVPAQAIRNVKGPALLTASKDPSFLEHIAFAPQIIQQIFVYQIISVDRTGDVIIQNVPDNMAAEIPPALLLGLSSNGSMIQKLNQKKWKRQQAELFFDVVAVESATAALGSPNNLSSSLLQGFTCTGVRSVQSVQVKKLIKACRRTGKDRVPLVETQLTCMYNYIKNDSETTAFTLYPPDVLLYYNYLLVPQDSCKSYFQQLAEADFSVFSSTLSYIKTSLFNNARSCLGITNTSLTEENLSILGNMCCTLNASYIQNSHPSILNKLGRCSDLSAAQAAAAQALLLSGRTQYGAPSQWSEQTLKDLGMLPLYLPSTFYDNFDKKTKRSFLRYFLTVLHSNGVSRRKKRNLMAELMKSIKSKSKRAIVNGCTVGTITQVTISDPTFLFDYGDITQFNCCLSASTVRDNLDAIVAKVDQVEYLSVVLGKLREIYPIVPEDQVRLLGPAARLATVADVLTWNITLIDTLSALMNPSDGPWDPILANAVISKYLSQPGNTLGTDELNSIGGANLCSLDANVLKNISQQSIKDAGTLTLSNCTVEQQQVLFAITEQAFATPNTRSCTAASSYQLVAPYIGGASLPFVQSLSGCGVNMDMSVFTSMQNSVVLNLTVPQVRGLLGTNLADMKLYENQPLVKSWITSQLQSELNALGIGLLGGRADPANPSAAPATVPGTAAPATKPVTASTTAVRADAGFSFLVLLSLLVASFV